MLYRVENVAKIDEASVKLFNKWKTLEALHPATDGLQGHNWKSPISEPDLKTRRQG